MNLIYERIYIFGSRIVLAATELKTNAVRLNKFIESNKKRNEAAVESAQYVHTSKSHTCAQIDTRISCNQNIYEKRRRKRTGKRTNEKKTTQKNLNENTK